MMMIADQGGIQRWRKNKAERDTDIYIYIYIYIIYMYTVLRTVGIRPDDDE